MSAEAFGLIDWLILFLYFITIGVVGYLSTKKQESASEYFRGARNIPMFAAALSFMATAQSAATFVGAPDQSYRSDLSYFLVNFGHIIAVLILGFCFIPVFYRWNVETIYGVLKRRFGVVGNVAGGSAFVVGRIFASGARLLIACMAASYIYYGTAVVEGVKIACLIITMLGVIYTLAGGIRAVIWTDVIQAFIYLTVLCIALTVMYTMIPVSFTEMIETLKTSGPNGSSKLNMTTHHPDQNYFTQNYTVWAILTGHVLLALGAYGTDHDMAQRFLTCKNVKEGIKSTLMGMFVGIPVQFLFLCIGLLLFLIYQAKLAGPIENMPLKNKEIFVHFILYEMPVGLKGLMMAGLFAAALSSVNSALNAISACFVNDVFPYLYRKKITDLALLKVGRFSLIVAGVFLGLFAYLNSDTLVNSTKTSLVDFALYVMVYAYSGLLAAFCAALFTKRGNGVSVACGIAVGFLSVYQLLGNSKYLMIHYGFLEVKDNVAAVSGLAFPWIMVISTLLAFLICILPGKKHSRYHMVIYSLTIVSFLVLVFGDGFFHLFEFYRNSYVFHLFFIETREISGWFIFVLSIVIALGLIFGVKEGDYSGKEEFDGIA